MKILQEEMEIGDICFCEVERFFDIQEVEIIRETNEFYIFEYNGKEIRRKKNRFSKSKEYLLERKLQLLTFNLITLKTTPKEIYENYKWILENRPEILI